jgi:hypothetical protein
LLLFELLDEPHAERVTAVAEATRTAATRVRLEVEVKEEVTVPFRHLGSVR